MASCALNTCRPDEARRLRGEGAVVVDRFRHWQAVGAAEREIVLAMAGGDVDEAGAGLGGDEVAGQQRHVEAVAALRRVPAAQGVREDARRRAPRP